MFGMAMKFFELDFQPINILRSTDVTNRQTPDPIIKVQTSKQNSKSCQNIKTYNNGKTFLPFETPDSLEEKENTTEDQLKQSRIKTENSSQINIQKLKVSQQSILQDYRKSFCKYLVSENIIQSDPNQKTDHSSNLIDSYDKVGGLVLSKIQELSEEYLEYSIRKEEFTHQVSLISGRSKVFEKSKNLSCDLINSVVRSVLFERNQEKDPSLSHSLVQKSSPKIQLSPQNFDTHQSNDRNSQINQTVTQFIKELFSCLGLINQSQMHFNSLNELTLSARRNFNQLKGDDYVQKLNQMLQSVQNIDKPTNQLELSDSLKFSHLYHSPTDEKQMKSKKNIEDRPKKNRKQILIKKEQQKKVKLISPETFSELDNKRKNIQNEISTAVQFLTKTRRARKFAFGSFKISQVHLNFSMDFKFMSYQQVQNKSFSHFNFRKMIKDFCSCTKLTFNEFEQKDEDNMTILSLPWNLVNLSKGIKTRNFIKHQEGYQENRKREQKLNEDRCLSLLFKNRTYDFEFESMEVRDEYFRSIKTLIKSSFEL